MVTERIARVRLDFEAPIVLLRHLRAPSHARAIAEVVGITELLEEHGGRALLVLIEEPVPPPSYPALREFRKLFRPETRLERIAILTPTATGFGHTIAVSVVVQILRMTPLAGAMRGFTELTPACMWLSETLDVVLDVESIGERLDALRASRPEPEAEAAAG